MKKTFTTLLTLLSLVSFAQLKPLGSWTEHMPHRVGTSITSNGTSIFCATRSGLFTFNTQDGSLSRYTKVNKLNDINVAQVKYNSFNGTTVIVYQNGNIDILKGNSVFNLPFIKDKIDITNKQINDISFFNEKAFLSFGFGIVELNTDRNEISDTYQFGNNGSEITVNSTVQVGNNIYGATDEGVYISNVNSNLLDFNSWVKQSYWSNKTIKKLFVFNDHIFSVVNTDSRDSIFDINNGNPQFLASSATDGYRAVFTNEEEIIFASANAIEIFDDNLNKVSSITRSNNGVVGILRSSKNNLLYIVDTFNPLVENDGNSDIQVLRPNGPFDSGVFDLAAKDGVLWAVPGGMDKAYSSTFNLGKIYRLEGGNWTNYTNFNQAILSSSYDLASIKINPENPNDVYFGSFGTGLYRFNEQLPFIKYDDSNSGLEQRNDVVWDWIGAVGVDFDENNNLWVTNSYNTNCLKARINNTWISYNFQNFLSSSTAVTDLIITESGHKWIVLPRDNAIIVFNDNGTYTNTADDEAIRLNSETGNGAIPGIVGINITKDKKGQIWVGTTDGIAVFFNPDQVFENGKRDAQRILIEGVENVEVLLASTTINDISIDGANRKWIATEEAGVYLLSEDGTEEIHHFTAENSPLLSNSVSSIAIDDKTGEVYFGTANGIISFRGTATEGKENFSDVSVFPNPVREDYTGPIAISGLMDNSTVKITDISGNLVNELRSIGGQAIWYGDTFRGDRAKTGVYLIFNSAENEEESLKTHVGKILLIN